MSNTDNTYKDPEIFDSNGTEEFEILLSKSHNEYFEKLEKQREQLEEELKECDDILYPDVKSNKGDTTSLVIYEDDEELKLLAAAQGLTVEELKNKILGEISDNDFDEEDMEREFEEISLLQKEFEDIRCNKTSQIALIVETAKSEGEENYIKDETMQEINCLETNSSSDKLPTVQMNNMALVLRDEEKDLISADKLNNMKDFIKNELKHMDKWHDDRKEKIGQILKSNAQAEEERLESLIVRKNEVQKQLETQLAVVEKKKKDMECLIEKELHEKDKEMQELSSLHQSEVEKLMALLEKEKVNYEQAKKDFNDQLNKKRTGAAVCIQKIFRGYRSRSKNPQQLAELKEMKILRKEEKHKIRLMELEYEINLRKENEEREKVEKAKLEEEERLKKESEEKKRAEEEKRREEMEKIAMRIKANEEERQEKKRQEEERQKKEMEELLQKKELEEEKLKKRREAEMLKQKEKELARKKETVSLSKHESNIKSDNQAEIKSHRDVGIKSIKAEEQQASKEVKNQTNIKAELQSKNDLEKQSNKLREIQSNFEIDLKLKKTVEIQASKEEEMQPSEASGLKANNEQEIEFNKETKENIREEKTINKEEKLHPQSNDDNETKHNKELNNSNKKPLEANQKEETKDVPQMGSSEMPCEKRLENELTNEKTIEPNDTNVAHSVCTIDKENKTIITETDNSNRKYVSLSNEIPEDVLKLKPKSTKEDFISRSKNVEHKSPEKENSALETLRLKWMKSCLPWSKVSNEPWKLIDQRTTKSVQRPLLGRKFPALKESLVLNAAEANSLREISTLRLTNLPNCSLSTLAQCWSLRYLTVSSNNLATLDGLSECKHLLYVDAGNNQLEYINFKDLGKLEVVKLSHNKLSSVHGFDGCINLRWIDLSHNQITRLSGFRSLRRLHTCLLNNNQLVSAEGIQEAVTLQHLDLSHNFLQNLVDVDRLCLLTTLSLCNNNLLETPKLSNHVMLQRLSLSDNSIATLSLIRDCWLPLLTCINIDGNMLGSLEGLENLLSLEELSIASNQITELKSLTDFVSYPGKLKRLKVTGNPFLDVCSNNYVEILSNKFTNIDKLNDSKVNMKNMKAKEQIEDSDEFTMICASYLSTSGKLFDEFQENMRNLVDSSDVEQECSSLFNYCDISFKMTSEQRLCHEYGNLDVISSSSQFNKVKQTPLKNNLSDASDKFSKAIANQESLFNNNSNTKLDKSGNEQSFTSIRTREFVKQKETESIKLRKEITIKNEQKQLVSDSDSESDEDDNIFSRNFNSQASTTEPTAFLSEKDKFEMALNGNNEKDKCEIALHGNSEKDKFEIALHGNSEKDKFEMALNGNNEKDKFEIALHGNSEKDKFEIALHGNSEKINRPRASSLSSKRADQSLSDVVDSQNTNNSNILSLNLKKIQDNDILRHGGKKDATKMTKIDDAGNPQLKNVLEKHETQDDDLEIDIDEMDFDVEKYLDMEDLDMILEKGWRPSELPQLPSNYAVLSQISTNHDQGSSDDPRFIPPVKPGEAWKNSPVLTTTRPDTERLAASPASRAPSSVASVAETIERGNSTRSKKDELLEEWGFKDNKTAEMMIARAKKNEIQCRKKKEIEST